LELLGHHDAEVKKLQDLFLLDSSPEPRRARKRHREELDNALDSEQESDSSGSEYNGLGKRFRPSRKRYGVNREAGLPMAMRHRTSARIEAEDGGNAAGGQDRGRASRGEATGQVVAEGGASANGGTEPEAAGDVQADAAVPLAEANDQGVPGLQGDVGVGVEAEVEALEEEAEHVDLGE